MALGTEDRTGKTSGDRLFADFLGTELGINGCAPFNRLGAGEVLRDGTNGARRIDREHV